MNLYYLNINSFGVTPLMEYIVKYLAIHFKTFIIESHIEGTNNFSYIKNKKYIKKYKNSYTFNNQTVFNKIYKYVFVLNFLLKHSFIQKKIIIYSSDFQVVALCLLFKKFFKKKNWKIVYHQFELIDKRLLGKENMFFYNKMKKHSKGINLVIVPERNRLNILLKQLGLPKEKFYYFPNINAIDSLSKKKHVVFEQLPAEARVVGHIGSIGTDHYIYSFIEAAKMLKDTNIFFLFVGKQNKKIKEIANNLNLKNILFVDEVPHKELKNIYSFLDLGFILYKGVDDNFEYCAPNKLYEYWAYGVPVIAHRLKGLESEFNDDVAGCLINLENPEEIAKSIKIYLEQDNKQKTSDYYKNKYNIEHFLKTLSKIIGNL